MILNIFRSKQGKCLSNRPRVSLSHNLWTEPPGRTYDEDMQCKMAFGQNFQFCDVSHATHEQNLNTFIKLFI